MNKNVSAANLVKQSMAQLVYLYFNESKRVVTEGQIKGNKFSDEFVAEYNEMRGTVKPFQMYLNFSIDKIHKHNAYEIKMAGPTAPLLLFRMSIIQSSLYCGLLRKCTSLKTATFYQEHGIQKLNLTEYKIDNYFMVYQDKYYNVCQSYEVYDFYVSKLLYFEKCVIDKDVSEAMQLARLWDAEWKHKEIDLLFNKIEYTICVQPKKLKKNWIESIKNWIQSMKLSKITKK